MPTPSIVRANNPCALRPLSRGRWKGQTGTIRTPGGAYCAFSDPVWGVRAGLRNLDTYRRRHRLTSAAQIIARWAPKSDNNPENAYARFIARRLGLSVLQAIPFDYDHTSRLIAAVIRFETGTNAVGPDTIAQAMALMAAEEGAAGRDPTPYLVDSAPLKPLTRSKEIALGGGAATIGAGGALAYAPEAIDAARSAINTGRDAAQSIGISKPAATLGEFACIGSFLILLLFGLAILANRLLARYRAER